MVIVMVVVRLDCDLVGFGSAGYEGGKECHIHDDSGIYISTRGWKLDPLTREQW